MAVGAGARGQTARDVEAARAARPKLIAEPVSAGRGPTVAAALAALPLAALGPPIAIASSDTAAQHVVGALSVPPAPAPRLVAPTAHDVIGAGGAHAQPYPRITTTASDVVAAVTALVVSVATTRGATTRGAVTAGRPLALHESAWSALLDDVITAAAAHPNTVAAPADHATAR